jgi:formamidopyrimidine-DNA glycosylase
VPELPEVETIVRDLRRLVAGARITDAEVIRPDLIGGDSREFEIRLRGARISAITRRAKNLVFDLGEERLVVNLGMTGRMLVVEAGAALPTHLGVKMALHDGRSLLYQDVRRFGRLEVLGADEWAERDAAMGVEPLSDDLDAAVLHRLTRGSRVALKTWLMDQRRVVGVGNIYASEALFRARLSPRRAAQRLTRRQAEVLVEAIRSVLQEAIDFRGTTLLDYRDASGERGEFSRRLAVYDREGDPCRVCASPIRRIVQGGRSTFFCPTCQRQPTSSIR